MLYAKARAKWIVDLNVKHGTMKLLQENIGGHLWTLGLEKEFLDITSKTQSVLTEVAQLTVICKVKCHWLDSRARHTPGLQVWFPSQGVQEATDCCFSLTSMILSLFLPPFPSL